MKRERKREKENRNSRYFLKFEKIKTYNNKKLEQNRL